MPPPTVTVEWPEHRRVSGLPPPSRSTKSSLSCWPSSASCRTASERNCRLGCGRYWRRTFCSMTSSGINEPKGERIQEYNRAIRALEEAITHLETAQVLGPLIAQQFDLQLRANPKADADALMTDVEAVVGMVHRAPATLRSMLAQLSDATRTGPELPDERAAATGAKAALRFLDQLICSFWARKRLKKHAAKNRPGGLRQEDPCPCRSQC